MPTQFGKQVLYYIKVKGSLNPSMVEWFGDITLIPGAGNETVLVGRFADQPALRGLLDHLWNLNLTIISVESTAIEGVEDSPQNGEKGAQDRGTNSGQ